MRLRGNAFSRGGSTWHQSIFAPKLTGTDVSRSPQGDKSEHEILRIFESDRGRASSIRPPSAGYSKTRVFPAERNAAVRTRLTHPWKCSRWGRYIAKEILSRLKEQRLLETYGLDELTGPFKASLRWPA